jgi:hypothetical protein
LKLNCTHQLQVYADVVNILGGSMHTKKKNTEALVVVSMKITLEANAETSKYIFISVDQHGGRKKILHKISNKSFERAE